MGFSDLESLILKHILIIKQWYVRKVTNSHTKKSVSVNSECVRNKLRNQIYPQCCNICTRSISFRCKWKSILRLILILSVEYFYHIIMGDIYRKYTWQKFHSCLTSWAGRSYRYFIWHTNPLNSKETSPFLLISMTTHICSRKLKYSK